MREKQIGEQKKKGVRAAARAAGVAPSAITQARRAGRISDPATTDPGEIAQQLRHSTVLRDPDYQRARIEREKYESLRAKAKYEEMAGNLMPVSEFEEILSRLCSDIRTAFLGLGSQVARELAMAFTPGECKAIVDRAVRHHLEILSKPSEDNGMKRSAINASN